ncbi:MAG: Na+/H+ antiporter subunit E [Firmicutes bacterium]|nr:Na+/H+ antiporter subunit E [Bacillota bacterium]
MKRQQLILLILLLGFWLIVSETVDLQHLAAGVVFAGITVWFWRNLLERMPKWPIWQEVFLLGHLLATLVKYIFGSNIAVAKTLLFDSPPVGPVFVVIRPPIESNWGRVLLSTCITITPGTVVVDIDPETGQFIVHALTAEAAAGLFDWQIIREISNVESWQRRRLESGLAVGRSHDSDIVRAAAGDLGPHSD